MLPRKSFKIKGPRLAKNAFHEISAWKNWKKNESARSLALKFGHFKKIVCWLWGAIATLPPALCLVGYWLDLALGVQGLGYFLDPKSKTTNKILI